MKNQVYAVVRIDDYQEGEAAIRVKKILPTMEDAIKEGERLSKLKSSKAAHYFWQSTNYFVCGENMDKAPPSAILPEREKFWIWKAPLKP